MPSGYDRIAGFYDLLARTIFGKSIIRAQQYGLSEIGTGSNLLIVGGGTGYVLEYLSRCRIDDLKIDYVETSRAMINHARQRNLKGLSVNFIHESIEALAQRKTYDVIITQFFLDSYQGQDLERILTRLDYALRDEGTWIIADFQISIGWKKVWQKLLLSIMYLFFSITAGIKARKLEDFQFLFTGLRYRLVISQSYYGGFMFSSTYQKVKEK